MEKKNNRIVPKTAEPCLDNYIKDENSVCREERQYALYLANVLRYYGKKNNREDLNEEERSFLNDLFNICGLDDSCEINKVFYEAKFMRDFFERNRTIKLMDSDYKMRIEDSFNWQLIKYVTEKLINSDNELIEENSLTEKEKIEEKNIGMNSIEGVNLRNNKNQYTEQGRCVRAMMNATPDIAVVYSDKCVKYLLLVECKFESREDTYRYIGGSVSQTEIQGAIADFLVTNGYMNDVKVSEKMKEESSPFGYKSVLVRFDRKRNEEKNGGKQILIDELIKLENTIFESRG